MITVSSQTEKKRQKKQGTDIRNQRGGITSGNTDIKSTIREYYEQIYGNNFNNLDKLDKLHG